MYHTTRHKYALKDTEEHCRRDGTDPVWPNRDRRDEGQGVALNPVLFLCSLHHVIEKSKMGLWAK